MKILNKITPTEIAFMITSLTQLHKSYRDIGTTPERDIRLWRRCTECGQLDDPLSICAGSGSFRCGFKLAPGKIGMQIVEYSAGNEGRHDSANLPQKRGLRLSYGTFSKGGACCGVLPVHELKVVS